MEAETILLSEPNTMRMRDYASKHNDGVSLLNIEEQGRDHHYIVFKNDVTGNLFEREDNLRVDSNIDECEHHYGDDDPVKKVIKSLREFCAMVRYERIGTYNRRKDNKVLGSWRRNEVGFRTKTISPSNLDISITDLARPLMTAKGWDEAKLKKAIDKELLKQRDATTEEARDFERMFVILETANDLKRLCLLGKNPNYGYSYSYQNRADANKVRLSLEIDEHNRQLNELKAEWTALCKKHKGKADFPTWNYEERHEADPEEETEECFDDDEPMEDE